MALIQANFISHALKRTVPIQVILPVDKLDSNGLGAPKQYKTLYLLHGYLGNDTDWLSGTRIQRWAQERDLAVVMPSGDNSFYVDHPESGNLYGQYIGQELVEITRRMFPLSRKREDTFIGGLSMGGYGALRNGLIYADTFSAIISLSGALDIPQRLHSRIGRAQAALVTDPENDPRTLIARLAEKKAKDPSLPLPAVYLSCGTEDVLLEHSRYCRRLLQEAGFDVTYREAPGGHDWDFWDTHIKNVVDWLPLEAAAQGIHSGNIPLEKSEK